MKKQLQIEAVANGFLAREPLYGGVASSPENTHVFSDASALGAWVAEYFGGPAPAAPELTQAPAPVPAPGVIVAEAQVRALRPGDVVILNTGERSTVIENDASGVPVNTNRNPRYNETRWFNADGRLRCTQEDGPDAPRIVKIEKKKRS